jgi:hypothetical protein
MNGEGETIAVNGSASRGGRVLARGVAARRARLTSASWSGARGWALGTWARRFGAVSWAARASGQGRVLAGRASERGEEEREGAGGELGRPKLGEWEKLSSQCNSGGEEGSECRIEPSMSGRGEPWCQARRAASVWRWAQANNRETIDWR